MLTIPIIFIVVIFVTIFYFTKINNCKDKFKELKNDIEKNKKHNIRLFDEIRLLETKNTKCKEKLKLKTQRLEEFQDSEMMINNSNISNINEISQLNDNDTVDFANEKIINSSVCTSCIPISNPTKVTQKINIPLDNIPSKIITNHQHINSKFDKTNEIPSILPYSNDYNSGIEGISFEKNNYSTFKRTGDEVLYPKNLSSENYLLTKPKYPTINYSRNQNSFTFLSYDDDNESLFDKPNKNLDNSDFNIENFGSLCQPITKHQIELPCQPETIDLVKTPMPFCKSCPMGMSIQNNDSQILTETNYCESELIPDNYVRDLTPKKHKKIRNTLPYEEITPDNKEGTDFIFKPAHTEKERDLKKEIN